MVVILKNEAQDQTKGKKYDHWFKIQLQLRKHSSHLLVWPTLAEMVVWVGWNQTEAVMMGANGGEVRPEREIPKSKTRVIRFNLNNSLKSESILARRGQERSQTCCRDLCSYGCGFWVGSWALRSITGKRSAWESHQNQFLVFIRFYLLHSA